MLNKAAPPIRTSAFKPWLLHLPLASASHPNFCVPQSSQLNTCQWPLSPRLNELTRGSASLHGAWRVVKFSVRTRFISFVIIGDEGGGVACWPLTRERRAWISNHLEHSCKGTAFLNQFHQAGRTLGLRRSKDEVGDILRGKEGRCLPLTPESCLNSGYE